jgi:prepilin peptidase CpaA
MTVPFGNAVAILGLTAGAAVLDVRSRRIPNLLVGSALTAALIAQWLGGGASGLASGLIGMLLAGGILLPGWLLRWMGAGDVKLMAAAGAWFGFPQSLFATLTSLMAGGVIALVLAARHRAVGRSLRGALQIGVSAVMGAGPSGAAAVGSGLRFPFAVAILAGCATALWIRP